MGLILLVLVIVAFWYYFAKYRPKKEQEKEEEQQARNQQIAEEKHKAREDEIFRSILSSPMFQHCCTVLDGFKVIKQNVFFGDFLRTEIAFISPVKTMHKRTVDWPGHIGALKLVVESTYSIEQLFAGTMVNPNATAENYQPKYLTANHGEMYDYFFSIGFPDIPGVGYNIEIYPSKQYNDEAEWVVYLFKAFPSPSHPDNGFNPLYEENGVYWKKIFDRLISEFKIRYPELNILPGVLDE